MRRAPWVAAFNRPTKAWSTSGPLTECDQQHWDLSAHNAKLTICAFNRPPAVEAFNKSNETEK